MASLDDDLVLYSKEFDVASKGNDLLLRYLIFKYSQRRREDVCFIRDRRGMVLYLSKCYLEWSERFYRRRYKVNVSDFIRSFSKGFNDLSYIVDDELSFIRRDEQKCFIFWYCIRVQYSGDYYEVMELPDTPKDHDEMYAIVQHYMLCADFEIKFKIKMLRAIREVCSDYDEVKGERKEPFKWVDEKNDFFISWAWSYARERMFKKEVGAVEHSRKKLLLTAAFFVWDAHRDTKRMFLKDMRGAWSQQKFRDKNNGNGRINTYISKEVKLALHELVEMDGTNIRAVLEKLVLDEIEKRKDKAF